MDNNVRVDVTEKTTQEVMPKGARMKVAVIGAGPAGLMAAEVLSAAGYTVDVYDAMASVGRKFLLAGKGGLNLTHSEPADIFASRFGAGRAVVQPWLQDFGATQVCDWAKGLGVDTFVGTSGRVFPADMKAAPLLRAWLHRLRRSDVTFHMRHRWMGWGDGNTLLFNTPTGPAQAQAAPVVLALGGGSWSRLGSDGAWVPWLAGRGVAVAPLKPSNCGFDVAGGWSEHFSSRFAGQPFKSVAIRLDGGAPDTPGTGFSRKGEFVATATGVEGSLIYAASSLLRDEITAQGRATFFLDLRPDLSADKVLAEVAHPRGSRSLSSHLKSRLGLDGIKSAILHELVNREEMAQPVKLAAAIKALPITLSATRPMDEAISSAGGVAFNSLDANLMLRGVPGVFCAGEMLDWEAPTGGYLLTACMASGYRAAQGVIQYVKARQ
jgi:uncharacterized flavoprotein (TIGR03862 family)